MDVKNVLKRNLQFTINAANSLLFNSQLMYQFDEIVKLIVQQYQKGGRLYIAGNGGSAADAQHLAAELVVRVGNDRAPLPAEALTVDSSILTAISNDYGFEKVFSRQLIAKATPNDIFLAISTSGNSPNIIDALKASSFKDVPSILLTGKDGGEAKTYADYHLIVPGERVSTIQEMHIVICHTLCECLESSLFTKNHHILEQALV